MPVWRRLVLDQRVAVEEVLRCDPVVSWAVLGRRVGVHATTVSREVGRGGGRERYNAKAAQLQADEAAKRPRDAKLVAVGELRDRVCRELKHARSPVAIAADLSAEGATERVCAESIYQALYSGALGLDPSRCLRRRRKRRRRRQERHASTRPGLPNISTRAAVINDRCEPGHWEGDLIIGARNQSAALTLIERQSRYGRIVDLPNGYDATEVLGALVEAFETIPPHLRLSLTLDQGSEWANWATLSSTYELAVYFCDPHSPWQRGAIENFNGHVRYWLPRGQRLDNVAPAELARIEGILNGQRRRSLNWASPTQLHQAATTPGLIIAA